MTDGSRGFVAGGFEPVGDAFARNFELEREDAAALAVYVDGELVVDLAAGRDRIRDRPLPDDYLMMVASCSKGVTATVLATLVEQGAIDPDAPVGRYWPEYACNGKEATTIAMVASHRAGLPFPPPGRGISARDYLEPSRLLDVLAAAAPLWEPGTAMAYHAVSYGVLLGEIVRRATGATIGEQLRRLVSRPLGLRTWLGLPSELDDAVVPGHWTTDPFAAPAQAASTPPTPGSYAALRDASLREAPPIEPDPADPAALRACYAAEQPAIGVITDAVSLARMYAATIGEVDGVRLISAQTLRRFTTSLTDDVPALIESGTAGPDIRFGLGYQLASGSMPGLGPSSFGHTGAGGRLGLADPEHRVALSYLCSRMQIIPATGDPRWAPILTAIRDCI